MADQLLVDAMWLVLKDARALVNWSDDWGHQSNHCAYACGCGWDELKPVYDRFMKATDPDSAKEGSDAI